MIFRRVAVGNTSAPTEQAWLPSNVNEIRCYFSSTKFICRSQGTNHCGIFRLSRQGWMYLIPSFWFLRGYILLLLNGALKGLMDHDSSFFVLGKDFGARFECFNPSHNYHILAHHKIQRHFLFLPARGIYINQWHRWMENEKTQRGLAEWFLKRIIQIHGG